MPGGQFAQRLTIGITLIMLLIVVAGMSWTVWQQQQLADSNACQSKYDHALAVVLAQRGLLADQSSAANEAEQAVLLLHATGPTADAARKTYLTVISGIAQVRRALPYPADRCG